MALVLFPELCRFATSVCQPKIRPIGIARWLSRLAHSHGVPCDLKVDAAVQSTVSCVEKLLMAAARLRREDFIE
jgi:hypothetical protein